MKKPNNRKEQPYIQTFLSKNKQALDCYIGGVKHEARAHEQNEIDDFFFQACKQINFIHQFGTIYLHKGFGYVCVGYQWFRFKFSDFQLLSN